MRQGFLKSVKNFFGKSTTPPKNPPKQTTRSTAPRIVSFGGSEDSHKKEMKEDDIDNRYKVIETRLTWKELGIKRDEALEGQTPILEDHQFICCKSASGKYALVTFILSDYQIFIKVADKLIHFPLGKIQKLQRYSNKQGQFKLLIGLKDGRAYKFRVGTEIRCKKVYDDIETFAFVRNKRHFFAFKHYEHNKVVQDTFRGWQTYDTTREFMRMGVELMPHTQNTITSFPSDFKILDNRDGKICPTYPDKIIVPARIPYDWLVRCSKFRSRCRMPALTFLYEWRKNSLVGVYRSSQSKVGVSNSRCPEDQMMLRLVGNPSADPKQTPDNDFNCVIYDARGKMAALGNKVVGKGYQSQQFYSNCRLYFLDIPNIHAVRESYNKALKAAQGEDSRFHSMLAESEWYDYVFKILEGASQVAKSLVDGYNVLIHCSDGWDRTSQLCALAGLFLDPFYRTMIGFHTLLEKDWIRFGHQFATRLGQGVNNPTGQQKSPIFFQFLDCVSQLLYQYPADFEFNYRYLQDMADLSQTNLYGNFLCNCELEMKDYGIQSKTVSLWSYFLKNKELYVNPYYLQSHPRLQPSTAQKHYRFWKQHFLQYVDGFQDIYDIYSCKFTEDNLQIMYRHLKQEKNLLQEKVNQNTSILAELNTEIQGIEQKQTEEQQ